MDTDLTPIPLELFDQAVELGTREQRECYGGRFELA